MVIGELQYKIEKQQQTINKLQDKNQKLQNKTKTVQKEARELYNIVGGLLNNEINLNEMQLIYNDVLELFNNTPIHADLTKGFKEIKAKYDNDYLTEFVISLFRYKPF